MWLPLNTWHMPHTMSKPVPVTVLVLCQQARSVTRTTQPPLAPSPFHSVCQQLFSSRWDYQTTPSCHALVDDAGRVVRGCNCRLEPCGVPCTWPLNILSALANGGNQLKMFVFHGGWRLPTFLAPRAEGLEHSPVPSLTNNGLRPRP